MALTVLLKAKTAMSRRIDVGTGIVAPFITQSRGSIILEWTHTPHKAASHSNECRYEVKCVCCL